MSKWFSLWLLFTAFSMTTCENTTAVTISKPTTKQMEQEVTKESRDLEILDMTSIINDCNDTFRTEMSYIESLNKSGSFPDETDKTAKCFVRCLLENSGVISEDGVFERERAPRFFAAQRVAATGADFEDSSNACIDRNETCICERSYQFVKCVVENELSKYEKAMKIEY